MLRNVNGFVLFCDKCPAYLTSALCAIVITLIDKLYIKVIDLKREDLQPDSLAEEKIREMLGRKAFHLMSSS